ncbi:TPA: hypothetical protein ACKFV5_004319 [Enterobacter roggenkampii]
MTANKPMTGEQLDELMTVAVNMQRDAETDCNRPYAMFAYAVQLAVLELRNVRNDAAALATLKAEAVAFRTKLKTLAAVGSESWDYTDHRQPDAFEIENCIIERLYSAPPSPANAEPVAWLWSHRKHPSEVSLVRPEDDERAEGAHWSGWSCQALYAAPPAPVSVPDDVSGPLAHAYKELTPTFMRNHIDVFERYGIYPDGSAGIQAMRIALDGMNRRAAMLQGAEPVTTAYKLPPESPYGYFAYSPTCGEEFFKRREDAVELCKDAVEEFRRDELNEGVDPAEVRRVCWGVIMQSGIDITVDDDGHIDYSLTPELIGNSPVIPECSCRTCRPVTISDMRFVVCPECGNKRCPHANDHRNACTGSNEPGQEGSAYPAAPQQEAE